jgi:hypothetical protein
MTSLSYPTVCCLLARGSSSSSRQTYQSESKYHQDPMQPTATHGFYKSFDYSQNETKHWVADNHFVSED